jgi:hypothetical protein
MTADCLHVATNKHGEAIRSKILCVDNKKWKEKALKQKRHRLALPNLILCPQSPHKNDSIKGLLSKNLRNNNKNAPFMQGKFILFFEPKNTGCKNSHPALVYHKRGLIFFLLSYFLLTRYVMRPLACFPVTHFLLLACLI